MIRQVLADGPAMVPSAELTLIVDGSVGGEIPLEARALELIKGINVIM